MFLQYTHDTFLMSHIMTKEKQQHQFYILINEEVNF